jgi:uncharacterized membrane protein YkvA (DUF1232 family)
MARHASRWGVLRTFGLAARAAARPGSPSWGARLAAVPRMVRAIVRGQYRGATVGSLGLMGLAAVYVVSPADLIPEGLFALAGLADDALVVSWLAAALVAATEDFLTWEQGQSPQVPQQDAAGAAPGFATSGPTVQSFVVR